MRRVKLVATILFYLSRFLSVIYFAMATHSLIALTTTWSLTFKKSGKIFQINYPFTQKPYLTGEYNLPYIIFDFLLPLSLYGLFFLMVSSVFKVFFQPKLFTKYGVKQLERFYQGNLILPGLAVLGASIFSEVDEVVYVLLVLHAVLGVFAFFLAAIFSQGLALQNEQDLYI